MGLNKQVFRTYSQWRYAYDIVHLVTCKHLFVITNYNNSVVVLTHSANRLYVF